MNANQSTIKAIPDKHRPTFQAQQNLLLKLAKQQKEMQRLESLLVSERERSNELTDRWAQARTLCGSLTDDTVPEVLRRIAKAPALLSRYGRHDRNCPLHTEANLPGDVRCTCGFSNAVA